jgi:hypothetical protein
MTGRERLRAALDHREPDAVPVDFNGTGVTGMHVRCVTALREHYGLERRPVKVHEPFQMLGWIDEDLRKVLRLDVEGIAGPETLFGFRNEGWRPWRMDDGTEVLVPAGFRVTRAANGDTLIHPRGDLDAPPSGRMPRGGFFFDAVIRQEPLDESRLDPAWNLEEFGSVTDGDLDYFEAAAARAEATGRGVIASFGGTSLGDIALVPGPSLKHPRGIRDIEEWYVSTVTRRPFIHEIFERQTAIALANLDRIHARVGDRVDVVFVCGTDFGTQRAPFCSVETFRELYLPHYARINGWIHRATSWKTFKHTCGAVGELIPSFIDSGFDILNPVQISASGMDPEKLKSDYGRDIVFWGGGIDTQKTLAFGSPEEIRAEVLSRCETLGRGGGFVFTSVHNIQADVPPPNIVAMFDAVSEFNGGH